MKGLIIFSVLALNGPACFALSMSPRVSQTSTTVPTTRLTTAKTSTTTRVVTQTTSPNEKPVLARVTVYWAGGKGSDRYTRQHKASTGCRLQSGHCAVDPRHIPYGSQVILADGTKLAAVDTGSAVRTRQAARRAGRNSQEKSAIVVDRFFETKRQALAWAQTHPMFMPVRVVTPNVAAVSKTETIQTTTQKYTIASNHSASSAASLNRFGN